MRADIDLTTERMFEIRTFPPGETPADPGWLPVRRRADEEVIAAMTPLMAHALGSFLDARQRGGTEREVRDLDKLMRSVYANIFRTIVGEADRAAWQIVALERGEAPG